MEAILLHQQVKQEGGAREGDRDAAAVGIPSRSSGWTSTRTSCRGGMRQRAMIAMALSCNPSLLIADEPTTALDVTIQAQILDLMNGAAEGVRGMAIMFITHNLGVIAEMADDVVVMYLGRVVEQGRWTTSSTIPSTRTPRRCCAPFPASGPSRAQAARSISGSVPDPLQPAGRAARFTPRCPDVAMRGRATLAEPDRWSDQRAAHQVQLLALS